MLVAARDGLIELLEHGDEFFDEGVPLGVDALAVLCHHSFVDADDVLVGLFLGFQHGVSLLQGFVVGHQGGHVLRVVLRDYHVHQASPLVAAAADDGGVAWGGDDEGQQPDVLCQPLVLFLVAPYVFLLVHLHADGHFFLCAVQVVHSLHHHHFLAVSHVHRVYRVGHALGEGEEVDGVQHVGLSLAVLPHEAVHLGRELQFCRGDVAIVQYGQLFQNHAAKVVNKSRTATFSPENLCT